MSRAHPQRGAIGGLEAIPFGILTFVVGALLVGSAWAVVDTKMAVTAAAREAARTYVEADSAAEGWERGSAAAQDAMADHGRRGPVTVAFDEPASFTRCAPVEVRVSYEVPAVPLPWIGGLGTTTVAARHRERIDPYRDGIDGAVACGP